jgi:hypothetical protein
MRFWWCTIIGPGETRGQLRPAKGNKWGGGIVHSSLSSLSTGGVMLPNICSILRVLAMKRSSGLIHFGLFNRFLRWLVCGLSSI